LIIPIAADRPFFQDLTIEAGYRHSHYVIDAAGKPKFSADTYKIGGTWQPIEAFKIRGNYQQAVRAPNIVELFAPVVTGLTALTTDPCAGAAPTLDANLAAICIAQGASPGSIGSIPNPTASQANGILPGPADAKAPSDGGTNIFGSGGGVKGRSKSRGGDGSIDSDTMTTGSATVKIIKPPTEPGGAPASTKLEKTKSLTNDSIIELVEAGFSEGTIIRRIEQSPVEFDLAANKLEELRRRRVSDKVLAAMKAAMGEDK